LNLDRETFTNWETGRDMPTAVQLEKLADIYKRPLAVFFLPEPPRELPLPKDFRTLPKDRETPLSPDTRLAVRRARRLQSLAKSLSASLGREPTPTLARLTLSADPEQSAQKMRSEFAINKEVQFRWRNQTQALKTWKKAVQAQGVLVFEMRMQEGIRAFSLTNEAFPTVVLNVRDALTARTFSLFHEYAHLLLNDGGICDWRDVRLAEGGIRSTERFCNHFAGALLVPEVVLRTHDLVERTGYRDEWPDHILRRLATDFRVSQEVILRRLTSVSLSSKTFYELKHEEWKPEFWKKKPRQKSEWPRNMPVECMREKGVAFVSLVLGSHAEGRITSGDVADYLGLRLKHLPKVQELVASER
jgi:Zn-dependent peptidase ImmA (M78 family)